MDPSVRLAHPAKKKPGRRVPYSEVVVCMGIDFIPVIGDELQIWLGGISRIYDELEEMIRRDEELQNGR